MAHQDNLPSGPLYEVRRSPGMNLGTFATDNILRGTRILQEKPLLRISPDTADPSPNTPDPVGLAALAAFEHLTPAERSKFLSLFSRPERPDDRISDLDLPEHFYNDEEAIEELHRVKIAFTTNAFEFEAEGLMVGFVQARINHSCTPNVCVAFNSRTGQITVHATKHIWVGDEFLVSYVDVVGMSTSERQGVLEKVYGFRCDCSVCDPASGHLTQPVGAVGGGVSQARMLSDSQENRLRLRYLAKDVEEMLEDRRFGVKLGEYQRGVKAVEEMVGLLKQEELVGMELTKCYTTITAFSLSRKNWTAVVKWAEKGMEQIKACLGRDAVAFVEGKAMLEEWKVLKETGGRGYTFG
ncbi:MAG: hypothetical protein Q9174_006107 [Haloplaca sp. 1 TL-2023]